jgi:HAD superfamily hydrolase (TIGR01450 family)
MTPGVDKPNMRDRVLSAARYDVCAFDIDGTICLGDELISGAADTIEALRRSGSRVVFLTNDASLSADDHADRLTRLGVPTSAEEVLTPIAVAVRLLQQRMPNARLFVIGERSVTDALAAGGFTCTDCAGEVDGVIVSHDRRFDYAKLRAAMRAARQGARVLATNADAFRPTQDGGEPGTGALLAALEVCSGAAAEVVGKPSIYMRAALRQIGGGNSRSYLIVGDQLDTDIRMGIEAGIDCALVLTGVTDRDMLERSAMQPTFVIGDLAELVPGELCSRR